MFLIDAIKGLQKLVEANQWEDVIEVDLDEDDDMLDETFSDDEDMF